VAAETDDFAVGHVEGEVSARVATDPQPQGVVPWLERRLDRLTPLNRADAVAVDRDLELTAPKLDADTLPRQPERC
jgi:hypothetical protein